MNKEAERGFVNTQELDSNVYESCIDLLAKSFPGTNYYSVHKKMRLFLDKCPNLKSYIVESENRCVGIQCIVSRNLDFEGVGCQIAGLSYAAIEPKYQNTKVGELMKKSMFEFIDQTSDISLGFARKIMDYYWYPYGYRGVTNFGEIKINTDILQTNSIATSSRVCTLGDILCLQELYYSTHKNIIGPLERTEKIWKYYLNKNKRGSRVILKIVKDGENIGYFIKEEDTIIEIGYADEHGELVLKHIIYNGRKFRQLKFRIGINHPISVHLRKKNHSISTRFSWGGGHILKITSLGSFLQKIRPALEARISKGGLASFNFTCNEFRFIYQNKKLMIRAEKTKIPDIEFENFEWAKLVFGATAPKYLSRYRNRIPSSILEVLFPAFGIQFLDLDQF